MVPQIIGAALKTGGGIASAAGQARRSGAYARASGMPVESAREIEADNAATRALMRPKIGALSSERTMALDDLIAALGAGRTAARPGAIQQAGADQLGAAQQLGGLIRPTPNLGPVSGLSTVLAARARAGSLLAPGQELRRLRLADRILARRDAEAGSRFGDVQTGLGRRAGEIQRDIGLRSALLGRRVGARQQSYLDAMDAAGREGMGLHAIGTFASNIGDSLTQFGPSAARQTPQTPPAGPVWSTGAGAPLTERGFYYDMLGR
jgi:hypothetical protein